MEAKLLIKISVKKRTLMVVFANGTSLSTNRGINSAFVSLSLGNLGGRTEACS